MNTEQKSFFYIPQCNSEEIQINDTYINHDKSRLSPDLETGANPIEGKYQVRVPQEVMILCEKIRSMGGRALVVGGAVRDTIISTELPGRKMIPKDFDIEVYGINFEKLTQTLEITFGNIDLVGRAFGVLKVPVEGLEEALDISIPRRDSKVVDEIIAKGDPTMTIKEGATRRDLTINSVSYDPLTGVVYDPFGGIEDIKNRRIEVTNREAFQEDRLRVIRVVQFTSRLEFEVSTTTKELCKEMVERGDLANLPGERITKEIQKMFLKSRRPSFGLMCAREFGIVEKLWPEINALIGVQQEYEWHPEGDVWNHTLQVVDAAAQIGRREGLSDDDRFVLILAALGHDLGKATTTEFKDERWKAHGHEQASVEPTHKFLARLSIATELKQKVVTLVPEHMKPIDIWLQAHQGEQEGKNTNKIVRRLAHRLAQGDTSIYMLSLVAEADQRGRNGVEQVPLERAHLPILDRWQGWLNNKADELEVVQGAPVAFIQGRDVISHAGGIKGGPWIGVVLKALYADQLDGAITTRESALEKVNWYLTKFTGYVNRSAQSSVHEQWSELTRMEDPRVLCNES